MRVYFTADEQADEKLQSMFSAIVDRLSEAGVSVLSNLAARNVSSFSSQDLEKIGSGEAMVERVDAVIIEGSRSLPETGYLVAIALAHKKPILYLTEKSRPVNKNLYHLTRDTSTAKLLHLKSYSESTLTKVLLDFLSGVERGEGKEVPNIKFTLRITARIERYLQWKTHNSKLTKADYLRHIIEEIIDADEEYQKFDRNKE